MALGSSPSTSTQANLRVVVNWLFLRTYDNPVARRGLSKSTGFNRSPNMTGSRVQQDSSGQRSRRPLSINPAGKTPRRHCLQKSGRSIDSKGERFFLQGKRWRLPRGLLNERSRLAACVAGHCGATMNPSAIVTSWSRRSS